MSDKMAAEKTRIESLIQELQATGKDYLFITVPDRNERKHLHAAMHAYPDYLLRSDYDIPDDYDGRQAPTWIPTGNMIFVKKGTKYKHLGHFRCWYKKSP